MKARRRITRTAFVAQICISARLRLFARISGSASTFRPLSHVTKSDLLRITPYFAGCVPSCPFQMKFPQPSLSAAQPTAQTAHNARLHLLRENDPHRFWSALSDRRLCLLCDSEFDGASVRITVRSGKAHFQCPQPHCQAGLAHFVHPGNPLLNEDAWADWMRPMMP